MESIRDIVEEAAGRIAATVRKEILGKLGVEVHRWDAVAPVFKSNGVTKKSRKKGPIQLCPAPGCEERAAPVYGMVCAKHKGTAKATIAKWREARRAKAKRPAKKVAKSKKTK